MATGVKRGNLVGGLGLVTLLRLLRRKDRVAEERRRAESPGDEEPLTSTHD